MNVDFNTKNKNIGIRLYNSLFKNIFTASNTENAIEFIKTLKNILTKLQTMYETDPTKLNDDEFYNFIINYYTIDLNIDDYLSIYNNNPNNKKYVFYTNFKTNMVDEVPKMSEPNSYKSWCLTPAEIIYNVLLSTDINYDYNKRYSIQEIEKMINRKDLILLKTEFLYLPSTNVNYQTEERKDFKIFPLNNCKRKDSPFYKNYISYLREIFNKERIINDFTFCLLELQNEMDSIFNKMNFINEQYKILTSANDMLNNSDEYKNYQKLLNLINK